MKLLVVEDDDRLRRNISHILQKERYYVTQVKTAEEALDYEWCDVMSTTKTRALSRGYFNAHS